MTVEITRHMDIHITGFNDESGLRIINGTESMSESMEVSHHGKIIQISRSMNTTKSDVVMDTACHGKPDCWPLSGTMNVEETHSGPMGDREASREVTYNATNFVNAIIDGESREIDLAKKEFCHKPPRGETMDGPRPGGGVHGPPPPPESGMNGLAPAGR